MPPKKIRVSLTVIEGEDKGKVFDIDKKKVVIGRGGKDIVLRDYKISRKHAILEIKKGKVYIRDAESTNGVFVNDVQVEKAELKNLDEITIGFSRLSIAIIEDLQSFKEKNVPSKRSGAKGDGPVNIGKMIEEELSKFSRWDVSGESSDELKGEKRVSRTGIYLEIVKGPDQGRRCRLRHGHTVLGRGQGDITFRDTDISRTHAEVEVFSKNQTFIRDLGSTNGTYVNGKKVNYAKLKDGDKIQMGGTVFVFVVPS